MIVTRWGISQNPRPTWMNIRAEKVIKWSAHNPTYFFPFSFILIKVSDSSIAIIPCSSSPVCLSPLVFLLQNNLPHPPVHVHACTVVFCLSYYTDFEPPSKKDAQTHYYQTQRLISHPPLTVPNKRFRQSHSISLCPRSLVNLPLQTKHHPPKIFRISLICSWRGHSRQQGSGFWVFKPFSEMWCTPLPWEPRVQFVIKAKWVDRTIFLVMLSSIQKTRLCVYEKILRYIMMIYIYIYICFFYVLCFEMRVWTCLLIKLAIDFMCEVFISVYGNKEWGSKLETLDPPRLAATFIGVTLSFRITFDICCFIVYKCPFMGLRLLA